jgi:hypothetical protein
MVTLLNNEVTSGFMRPLAAEDYIVRHFFIAEWRTARYIASTYAE